jgi:hypothetical protein
VPTSCHEKLAGVVPRAAVRPEGAAPRAGSSSGWLIGMEGSGNLLTVYLTLALSAITMLVLISAKLRELLAPVFWWLGRGRALGRIKRVDEAEDARVADLTRQVAYLTSRVTALETDAAAHREMVMEHATWDVYAIVEAGKAGVTLEPPPALLTQHIVTGEV